MFAYAVAESFIATGVGASLINLALKLGVTGRTVAVISLIVTCLLSVATGTSWGTFAACAPIFLWLSELVGGDPILTVCAIAGGSCFGDNIGMISDVTVLSCGMQDVRIIDRVKHQSVWSCSCLVLAAVVIFCAASICPTPRGTWLRPFPRSLGRHTQRWQKSGPWRWSCCRKLNMACHIT